MLTKPTHCSLSVAAKNSPCDWLRVKPNSKVLLLSPFFHPESISTGKYNTVLAESLVKRGAEVEVITSHPFYPAWRPVYSQATLDHVSIIRGGDWVRYPRAMMLRRLVFESWYAFHVLWTISFKRFQP